MFHDPRTTPADFRRAEGDALDAPYLRALAELAESRGDLRFTPGGGVLFDSPMRREERAALPPVTRAAPRFLDLPGDGFRRALARDAGFAAFARDFTVAHRRAGYRLVVIPLAGRLSPDQLRAIADAAEIYGHGTIRLTADVSIRLPNVPEALLHPLYRHLQRAGLSGQKPHDLAA